MNGQPVILLCLMLFFVSCKKTAPDYLIPNGIYSGTFQRLTDNTGLISKVTITFSGNTWKGISQYDKYPALCQGTYFKKNEDSISFENACVWTAEFDWTLILGGDYKISISGKNIQLTKSYDQTHADVYNLTRK